MRLEISSGAHAAIVAHVDAVHPIEACGLLFGDDHVIATAQPCSNIAADPARHFEIDPAQLLAAHKAMRSGGPQLIGHYHSHPVGDGLPSDTDAACARSDGSYWLIVSGPQDDDDECGWLSLFRAVPGGRVKGVFEPVNLDFQDNPGNRLGAKSDGAAMADWGGAVLRLARRAVRRTTTTGKKRP
jgi:proteasome lid subunit RPN8/RPN11